MSPLLEALLENPDQRDTMLAELDGDELVQALEATADALDKARTIQERATDLRMALWQAARDRDPKVTQARLAAASRVSEPFVIRELGKARKAAAAAG